MGSRYQPLHTPDQGRPRSLLAEICPGGIVMVPEYVSYEIDAGRELHPGIPTVSAAEWAQLAVLDDTEEMTAASIKANLGGTRLQNLGECAVISCAKHRGLVAIIDDRAAIAQAELHGVTTRDTLWVVLEAYKSLYNEDRSRVARVVDDLLDTGMQLPIDSGEELIAWAYVNGLLP